MNDSEQRYKELGNFSKTRRAKIIPSQVGLPEGMKRRTPGLRREEVASLSGIGLTWYTWLEQGRTIQVSSQVLESLSRVLMLDKQEIIHLYALAQQVPPSIFPNIDETVKPMVQHVLDSMEFSPSLILDSRWNVIAWNKVMAEILSDFSNLDICNRNILWIVFTNEEYKKLFSDWELHARSTIARFRASCSKYIDDPWITEFVTKLRRESKEFDLWWPMHDVETEQELYKVYNHSILGELKFEHTSFFVANNTDLKMIVNTPLSGTDTKEKIKQYLISKNDKTI